MPLGTLVLVILTSFLRTCDTSHIIGGHTDPWYDKDRCRGGSCSNLPRTLAGEVKVEEHLART